MLYLTRKRGESIDFIDRASGEVLVSIQVTEILPGGVVRIGCSADKGKIDILRDNAINRSPQVMDDLTD